MLLKIVAFVIPLGFDTLAISIVLGLRKFGPWRAAALFAFFEGVMPIVGIGLARVVGMRLETAAVVVGGIILIAIGVHAIREASEGCDETEGLSFDSLRSSLLAGVAISTDELAVGFPLGASGIPIVTVLTAIVLQAFIVTAAGIALGNRIGLALGKRASRYAQFAAGAAFSSVGIWLIAERLVGL